MLYEAQGDPTLSLKVLEELEINLESEQAVPATLTKAERNKLQEANIRIYPDPLEEDKKYDES